MRCSSSTSAIHKIAVTEAKKLGIPIVAVVDTNHSPDRHRARDPGQRRFEPRDPPVRARRRRRGARRHAASRSRRSSRAATSSSKWRTRRRPDDAGSDAASGPHAPPRVEAGARSRPAPRVASAPGRTRKGRRKRTDWRNEHGGHFREHGDGAAPAHRAGHDGVQEGADRDRRRSREGRGAAAHQERREGVQGRGPRRGGRRDRRCTSRRTARPARSSK